ncbi:peroxidase-related enzyme [Herbidospora galbida]|uniref:Peroxidase-related enzyme n=1 Tax=Herbidospora galbida TaxID=2575442 RepID=A0A4U3MSF0_9ACTN|nr:peroxidase-related enzyme [Herbidospora galbida]TKK91357.1 peroxidase-related enzyme [Herbidospora galbida]
MTPGSPGVNVPIVTEAAATGDVAELYGEIRDHFGLGLVPDVFKLVSTRSRFLKVFWDGYRSVFDEGELSRDVKELIAAFVAREVSCHYCVDAHTLFLDLLGADAALKASLSVAEVEQMDLPEPVRELLRLAKRITDESHRVTEADFAKARACGWSDAQILEALWTACQFNWVTRMVSAAGLVSLGQLAEFEPATGR